MIEGLFTWHEIVFIVSFRYPAENFNSPIDFGGVVLQRIPAFIKKSTIILKYISLIDSVGFYVSYPKM